MKMKLTIVAAAALLALAGCSAPAASPEDLFTKSLAAAAPTLADTDPAKMIEAGRDVCTQVKGGKTLAAMDEFTRTSSKGMVKEEDMITVRTVQRLSVAFLCPEFKDQL